LSIEARDQLVDRIRTLESGKPVVRAFGKAGLGDPVQLDLDGKRLVIEVINLIGLARADPQLVKLRHYLIDELDAK
jgi:hypothetical protein